MTMALHARGLFEWEEFRARLIAEIGAWERAHPDRAAYRYYACWLAALESLLAAKGLCPRTAVDTAVERLAARPPGHDHDDHDHDGSTDVPAAAPGAGLMFAPRLPKPGTEGA
jgi:nitrile hydratase accessory protein